MKLLVKTLTRDISVICTEIIREAFANKMPKFFGVPFTENFYIVKGGAVSIYRDNDYFFKELPVKLANWAQSGTEKMDNAFKLISSWNEVYKKISSDKLDNPQDVLAAIKEVIESASEGFSGLIVTFWFPIWQESFQKEGRDLFPEEIVKAATRERSKNEKFFDEFNDVIYSLLAKVAKIKNWPPDLLKYIRLKELEEAIDKNSLVVWNELQKRQDNTFAYVIDKIVFEPEINRALEDFGYEIEDENVSVNELSGSVAYRGFVKGKTRVILSKDKLGNMVDGEILVAAMTVPWYLPAIKKAVAIITDEGGITCHAAIIARELKKPCIIGTKIATQVLKDGDLVEVDANRGVVRTIEKAK